MNSSARRAKASAAASVGITARSRCSAFKSIRDEDHDRRLSTRQAQEMGQKLSDTASRKLHVNCVNSNTHREESVITCAPSVLMISAAVATAFSGGKFSHKPSDATIRNLGWDLLTAILASAAWMRHQPRSCTNTESLLRNSKRERKLKKMHGLHTLQTPSNIQSSRNKAVGRCDDSDEIAEQRWKRFSPGTTVSRNNLIGMIVHSPLLVHLNCMGSRFNPQIPTYRRATADAR